MADNNIFRLENVKVWFPVQEGFFKKTVGHVKAVDDVTINVKRNETLGIVGESGCGKTTLGKAMMLLEKITGGHVYYNDDGTERDITTFNKDEVFQFRKKVQMIFQDPYSAMNPMKKIYTEMEEPLIIHGYKDRAEREAIMEEALKLVNIPVDYLFKYPHEFSGGQRQRVCIARAMEINPKVLVCDEAVSALDVSIQAQVLNLMKDIQKEKDLTYVFIAHDLSVVQYMSDRILVMYLGKAVEMADSKELYDNTLHPYTVSLLSAIPVPVIDREKNRIILKGDVPSPINKPSGCPFHKRCDKCMKICEEVEPELKDVDGKGHFVACHLYD
ncbi:MAG: ATP-binding cassette domain-containing protein [Lachnospiraceae bacterium]|nr:ATP-binding cassette domain-containing protein [Lachnospiraceae bacterium]